MDHLNKSILNKNPSLASLEIIQKDTEEYEQWIDVSNRSDECPNLIVLSDKNDEMQDMGLQLRKSLSSLLKKFNQKTNFEISDQKNGCRL